MSRTDRHNEANTPASAPDEPPPTPGFEFRLDETPGGTAHFPVPSNSYNQGFGTFADTPVILDRAMLPFQYPSLDHLDDAIDAAIKEKSAVDGESEDTSDWRRCAYASLRTFLVEEPTAASSFLAGDHRRQHAVLRGWIAWRRKNGNSHSTVNTHCRALASTFMAISTGTEMASPMLGFPIPKAGEPRRPRLHARRVAELIEVTRNMPWRSELERTRNVAIIGILSYVGLRAHELLALKLGDVNVETGSMQIQKGKGRHGGSSREVYVPQFFRPQLRSYLAARLRAQRSEPAFFVSLRGEEGIGAGALKALTANVGKMMDMHLSPHMLRRTCEDWMRLRGVPPLMAMRQLGHKSVAMLLRYSQTTPEEHGDAFDSLDHA